LIRRTESCIVIVVVSSLDIIAHMMFYYQREIIGLLFHFLLNWNLKLENFVAGWRRKRISPGQSCGNKTFFRIGLKTVKQNYKAT